MDLYRFSDADALARRVAEDFIALGNATIQERSRFAVALSGGSTPKKLHQILVADFRDAIDWSKVDFYLGDDRFVPPADERSNERMVRQTLLYPLGISESHIFMPYADLDVLDAAMQYDSRLPDALDLVLLGLGTDGHTLSLFPGDPCVTGRKAVAAKAPVVVTDRITLTAEYANQSAQAWFLVAGADKQAAMQQMLQGDYDPAETPSQAIARKHPRCRVFADEAALSF